MKFRDRLGMGLRFIITGQKTVAGMRSSWESTQPSYVTGAKFEELVKHGYRRNELIYACINKTASSAAQISLQLKSKRDEKIIREHPLLNLIHRPNETMNESDLWASIAIFQKLAGRAVFEIELSNRGAPVALWPLNPDRLQIVQAKERPVVQEYIYKVPGMEDQHLKPEQVLDFPIFDPLDRFKTYPPVAVCARAGDIDNAATDHIKLVWEHGGMPPGLLKTTQVLQDADVADIRRRWSERYSGHTNWLEPAVLDRDAEYQKTGMTFEELGFDALDSREEARICMVLDVPPILVGAKVGLDRSTYSNYQEARASWWEDTLLPMYVNYMDTIEYRLLPRFDPRNELSADWNISKVFAFQDDRNDRWKRATEGLRAGGLTVNEFYQEIGLETIGPAGDVYLRGPLVVEVPAKTMKSSNGNGHGPESKAAGNAPDDDVRRKHERIIKRAMKDYFESQQERLLEDLRNGS